MSVQDSAIASYNFLRRFRFLCSPTLRKERDVRYSNERHEESGYERERNLLHQGGARRSGESWPHVEPTKEDSEQKISDAKKVPDKEPSTKTEPVVGSNSRGDERGGHCHGDVAKPRGPCKPACKSPSA